MIDTVGACIAIFTLSTGRSINVFVVLRHRQYDSLHMVKTCLCIFNILPEQKRYILLVNIYSS